MRSRTEQSLRILATAAGVYLTPKERVEYASDRNNNPEARKKARKARKIRRRNHQNRDTVLKTASEQLEFALWVELYRAIQKEKRRVKRMEKDARFREMLRIS